VNLLLDTHVFVWWWQEFAHAEGYRALPPHHGDPFDRMLAAQALVEKLTLVTHDRQLEAYSVPILWA